MGLRKNYKKGGTCFDRYQRTVSEKSWELRKKGCFRTSRIVVKERDFERCIMKTLKISKPIHFIKTSRKLESKGNCRRPLSLNVCTGGAHAARDLKRRLTNYQNMLHSKLGDTLNSLLNPCYGSWMILFVMCESKWKSNWTIQNYFKFRNNASSLLILCILMRWRAKLQY